jgi:hypothetical protein
MTYFRLGTRSIPTCFLLAAVASCGGSVRPITKASVIDGRPAPYFFRHLLSTYTLPPGRYEPTFEDDSGAYFAAPTKIAASEMLAASLLYDGGLYLRTDGLDQVDAYVIVRNQPLFVTLPRDFPLALRNPPAGVGTEERAEPVR